MPVLNRSTRLAGFALAMIVLPCAAPLAGAEGPRSSWMLAAGADVGEDDSHGFSASADFASRDDRYAFGLAGQQSTGPSATASGTMLDSISGQVSAGMRLGWARLELGFDTTRDEDLRRSQQITVAATLRADGWHGRVGVSRRQTDFDDLAVDRTITLRNGATFELVGAVGCDMDDTGYEAGLGYGGEDWDLYVNGQWASFDRLDCDYSSAVPRELRHVARALFGQFVGDRAALLSQRIGGRIGQRSALLDTLYGAGLSRQFDAWGIAFDYTRSASAFDGTVQDGYAVTGSWYWSARTSLDLTMGTTVQTGDNSPYLGVQVGYRL